MKRISKKISILLCLVILAFSLLPGRVAFGSEIYDGLATDRLLDVTKIGGYPQGPEVDAEAIILIEAKSGTILYQKNAYKSYFPASITKIMTALLTIENCSLDEIVTFSYRATHDLEEGSSGIARTEGEQMSVRECLYAMLVSSANEVAQALAEHVSGSIEAFADLMNKRAAELGCTGTHFANPSGLNNEQHYTTCHDMAIIMAEAIKNPTFVEIDSTTVHTVPATNKHAETLGISMKHELLKGSTKYPYAICGKTGYTGLAGFTLVTYAAKNDMDLICVTLHCQNQEQRSSSTRALFDYGFDNFSIYKIGELDPTIFSGSGSGTSLLDKNLLSLSIPDESYMVLPQSYGINNLTSRIDWGSSSESGSIATISYLSGSNVLGRAGLYIDSSEGLYDFLGSSTIDKDQAEEGRAVSSSLLSALKILGILLIAVIVVTVIGLILYRFINGKSKRRKRGAKISRGLKRNLR